MKKLFSEKSHMISKLFVYQIAMSLLGLFIVSPFANNANSKLCLPFGIFSMLFYFSLICYAIVEDGQNDHISVSAGRKQASAWDGFKYALVSYMPTVIIVVSYMIVRLANSKESITGFTLIVNVIIRFFLMGMYLGVDASLRTLGNGMVAFCDNGVFFALCLVIMPVVAGLAYALAYNGKIHVNTQQKKKK